MSHQAKSGRRVTRRRMGAGASATSAGVDDLGLDETAAAIGEASTELQRKVAAQKLVTAAAEGTEKAVGLAPAPCSLFSHRHRSAFFCQCCRRRC